MKYMMSEIQTKLKAEKDKISVASEMIAGAR